MHNVDKKVERGASTAAGALGDRAKQAESVIQLAEAGRRQRQGAVSGDSDVAVKETARPSILSQVTSDIEPS